MISHNLCYVIKNLIGVCMFQNGVIGGRSRGRNTAGFTHSSTRGATDIKARHAPVVGVVGAELRSSHAQAFRYICLIIFLEKTIDPITVSKPKLVDQVCVKYVCLAAGKIVTQINGGSIVVSITVKNRP